MERCRWPCRCCCRYTLRHSCGCSPAARDRNSSSSSSSSSSAPIRHSHTATLACSSPLGCVSRPCTPCRCTVPAAAVVQPERYWCGGPSRRCGCTAAAGVRPRADAGWVTAAAGPAGAGWQLRWQRLRRALLGRRACRTRVRPGAHGNAVGPWVIAPGAEHQQVSTIIESKYSPL